MKRLFPLFCMVALLLTACNEKLAEANYDVIPIPKEVMYGEDDAFVLTPNVTEYYEAGNTDLQRNAEFLSSYVKDLLGFSLQVQEQNQDVDNGIVLSTSPDAFDETEAYQIDITKNQIVVLGSDAAGVFYGIQTLRKSLPIGENGKVALPCVTIKDYPRFNYRGMHLDPSRHFFTLDSVKQYVDMMIEELKKLILF